MTAIRYTIDRFEDNGWVVLEREDGTIFNIPASWVPGSASEGDVLKVETAVELGELKEDSHLNGVYFEIDQEETQERRNRVKSLRNMLPKGPQGDIEL